METSTIGGTPPTHVTAEQTSLTTVLVTWTAPATPPSQGYKVLVTRGAENTTTNVSGTSHNISVNNQYGVYSIRVRSLSQHFPGEAEPVTLTVQGTYIIITIIICFHLCCIYFFYTDILPPTIARVELEAKSVTINWTGPEFSSAKTITAYTISWSATSEMCQFDDTKEYSTTLSPNTTTFTFTDLQEFTNYTITVTANFSSPEDNQHTAVAGKDT